MEIRDFVEKIFIFSLAVLGSLFDLAFFNYFYGDDDKKDGEKK